MSQYTPPPKVSGFRDPDDAILFPRLAAAQIEQLAEHAETVSFAPGEILFEQGQRETPFFVVLSGAVDIIDRQPDGDHYFTQCQAGTFVADISMFTGEPTLARGVVAEESSVLVMAPDELRRLVAGAAELGDLLLRTMVVRREWLKAQGYGLERLIGRRSSGDALAIRELLERNLVPFSWHDIDTDEESKALLDRLGIGADAAGVEVRRGHLQRSRRLSLLLVRARRAAGAGARRRATGSRPLRRPRRRRRLSSPGEDARRPRSFAEHRGDGDGQPLLLKTTRPDVFAIGDVRSGSTKRVASAVVWQHFYYQSYPLGSPASQYFASSDVAGNGGALALGFTTNPSDYGGELLAVKTDGDGLVGACSQVSAATPLTALDPGLATIAPALPVQATTPVQAAAPAATQATSVSNTARQC